jgi:hypothetical protein
VTKKKKFCDLNQAEVLGSDEEMLFLDIGTLVKRYPDVTYDQVRAIDKNLN